VTKGESSPAEGNDSLVAGTPAASRLAIWALALFAPTVTFIGTITPTYYLSDFWHHVAIGREIVRSGAPVYEDRFTFTVAGQPLRDAAWLSQVIDYGVFEAGGLALVRTMNSLVLAGAIGVLVFLCQRASGSLLLATVLGVFTYHGLLELLIVRPQSFAFLLFGGLFVSLELSAGRRSWLLLAPVIQALWVNLHGSFPVALVVIGIFALDALGQALLSGRWARFRDLLLVLGAAVLATGINPFGFDIYSFVFLHSSSTSRGILDWQPPWQVFTLLEWRPPSKVLELNAGKIWIVSILLVFGSFALPARRPSLRDWCLALVFLAPTFRAVRMFGWWYLATMPLVAAQVGALLSRVRWPASQRRPSPLVGGLCLGLVGLVVVLSLPGVRQRLSPEPSPVESKTEIELEKAAQFLHDKLPQGGRIFCQLEWGGYFNWSLQPDGFRVFMDIRMDIIPDAVWDEYMELFHARADWQAILDKYDVTVLVLNVDHADFRGLINQVEQSARWQAAFRDGNVVIFLRKNQSTQREARGM